MNELINRPVWQSSWLMVVVVGGLLYIAGQYVASQPQRIQQEAQANREISVTGTGRVETRPDTAWITLSVTTGTQATADGALLTLTTRFNAAVAAIKGEGVDKDDIKSTNLSINPVYDYSDGQRQLRGFEATESVGVKIRDLKKVGAVVTKATAEGVNQVGGIEFGVDDPVALENEAKVAAIDDAKAQAELLTKRLGTRLGQVKSFSVAGGSAEPSMPMLRDSAFAEEQAEIEMPSGTSEIVMTVYVVFELR